MGNNWEPAIALCSTASDKSKQQIGNIARHLTRDARICRNLTGFSPETSGRFNPAQAPSVYIVLYANHTNGALEANQ
jgi:hypothetical protein